MVNQAFRIKIAYRSEKEKEKKKEEKKIPGIGRYPMGPTNICDLLIRQKHFLPKNTILNICGPKKHFFASVSSIYLRYGPGFAEGPPVT